MGYEDDRLQHERQEQRRQEQQLEDRRQEQRRQEQQLESRRYDRQLENQRQERRRVERSRQEEELESQRYDQRRLDQRQEWQRLERQLELQRRYDQQPENQRHEQLQRTNETHGFCVNMDGPAVFGSLCVSCYAPVLLEHRALLDRAMAEELERQCRERNNDVAAKKIEARTSASKDLLGGLLAQRHHLATEKGLAAGLFQDVLEPLILQDADWNKVEIPRQGRSPAGNHDFGLGTMDYGAEATDGDKEKLLALFRELIKETMKGSPEMLRKRAWNE